LNVIFDPSCSKSRPGTNGEQGTGFGLPIVKRMLEEMNGSIKIDSTVKTDENDTSGTTMSILIPLVQN
jgi:signal transduction histidine kinase